MSTGDYSNMLTSLCKTENPLTRGVFDVARGETAHDINKTRVYEAE
jgi:hypothetical protein